MLFSHSCLIKQNTRRRKEIDSFLVIEDMSNTSIITSENNSRISPMFCKRRASICTSQRGSVTVEAALALPLFFFAVLCVIYLLEVMSLEMNIYMGMHNAMNQITSQMSKDLYVTDSEIQTLIIEGIGAEWLDGSLIVGGSQGLDSSESEVSILQGIVELEVSYEIQLPITIFGVPTLYMEESMRGKGWTGYVAGISSMDDEVVYVTENGSVYHLDYNCTYLQLSITSVEYEQVAQMRNVYGGIYDSCELCVEEALSGTDTAYVATSGDSYHSTLSCSGLKRTIYSVLLSEVNGKGVCSRCGS